MNKAQRVLEFIGSHGEAGVRYTDIQKFICKMNGKNWDEFSEPGNWDPMQKKWVARRQIGPGPGLRRHNRGIWGTNLDRLLNDWCLKNVEGRWVLYEYPIDRSAYHSVDTDASVINTQRRNERHKRWLDSLPVCGGCGRKVYHEKFDLIWKARKSRPENEQRCQGMSSGGYMLDCNNGVWAFDSKTVSYLPTLIPPDAEQIYKEARSLPLSNWDEVRNVVITKLFQLHLSRVAQVRQ